jgi:hypothetical protein
MVHGVAAVDIGESVVYGAVDRNEEMGLRVDWSIGGIGGGRGHHDGRWADLWRKHQQRDECHRVIGHIHHALRKQEICCSETEKIEYTQITIVAPDMTHKTSSERTRCMSSAQIVAGA